MLYIVIGLLLILFIAAVLVLNRKRDHADALLLFGGIVLAIWPIANAGSHPSEPEMTNIAVVLVVCGLYIVAGIVDHIARRLPPQLR